MKFCEISYFSEISRQVYDTSLELRVARNFSEITPYFANICEISYPSYCIYKSQYTVPVRNGSIKALSSKCFTTVV
jgi:hypothetical protein